LKQLLTLLPGRGEGRHVGRDQVKQRFLQSFPRVIQLPKGIGCIFPPGARYPGGCVALSIRSAVHRWYWFSERFDGLIDDTNTKRHL
jgi:hypothetical protein